MTNNVMRDTNNVLVVNSQLTRAEVDMLLRCLGHLEPPV